MAYREDVDYQALINQAIQSGDYKAAAQYEQSRNEKINALNAAGGGTNKYGAEATNNYSNWLSGGSASTGSATGVGTYTTDQQKIRDEMNANSMQWYDATDEAKASLHAENEYLASLLGNGVTWDSQTGYWSGAADQPTTDLSGLATVTGRPVFDSSSYEQSQPTWDGTVFEESKPTYESSYSAQIDDLLNQILNRESFSYNVETDPLYQQYASTYNREGQRAMNDTLAAAAAGAGGMNSSAITAAQQARNYYGAQLGDKVPELYQMAYQMYLDDIDNQVRNLGLLQGMDDTQYNRYRDTMSDWRNDRDFAYGVYRDDVGDWDNNRNFDYGAYRDSVGDYQWQQNFDYNAGRDAVSDSRYESEVAYDRAMSFLNAGVMPDASVLAAAGISSEEANRVLAALQLGGTGSTGGSGGGSGYGDYDYTNGGMTEEEILAIQKELGVTEDGLWGPATQAAYDAKYGAGNAPSALDGYSVPEGWTREDVVKFQKENGLTPDGVWGPKTQAAYEAQNADEITDEDRELANAIIGLGLGPVSASLVEELLSAQAIRENRGKFEWQKGWNAQNYRAKLQEKQQSGAIGLFNF